MTAHALDPAEPVLRIVRDLPGTRREWVHVTARVSGLLLSARGTEACGGPDLPVPLRGGAALRAWARIVRPVMDRSADHVAVAVPAADLAVVADAAATLGRLLCRARTTGVPDSVSRLLEWDAEPYFTTPEWIVTQVARVHGVLTSTDPEEARLVWRAGAG